MSNVFEKVLSGVENVGKEFTGEAYPYYKYIKTPSELGMSDKGSLQQMAKDISGLIGYVEVLVTGKGEASATGQPLGNKFFLQTGGKCMDKNKVEQDRWIYIDNIPAGNIPFISTGLGVNFSEFRGLIPGTISNLNAFNPANLFSAFLAGSKPDCQELTMEVVDVYNNKSTQTHYVTLTDIKNMDPCIFQDGINPLKPDSPCRQTFTNMNENDDANQLYWAYKIPDDPIVKAYFASLGALSVYVLYKIMAKNGMVPR
jgi:hypothetical protein